MNDHRDAEQTDASTPVAILTQRLAQAEAALKAESARRRQLEKALEKSEKLRAARPPAQESELAQANAALQAEIQKHRRTEEAAKVERQRFNAILDMLPAYLVLLAPDYHVPFANRFFRERFGESDGRRCFEYLFDRSEPCEICDTYKTLSSQSPLRWEWLGPDGHNYDVFDFPFTEKDGSTLILEMGIDITERKQAEQALQAAGEYNRSLIEASLDPLVTIGADGKITDVNAATEAVTGVARAQLIGSDFSQYFTEPEQASAGYRQALADGKVLDYPLTIRHVSGRTIDVLYHATVYRNQAGEVQGVFAAARDITERKRAEAELEKYRDHLEELVQERTAALQAANAQLQAEIAERKRVEAALRDSEEQLRLAAQAAEQRAAELDAVFNSISSGMMFYGPDSRIGRINPAAEAILGYTLESREVPFAERARRMRIESSDGRPMAFDQMPAVRAFRGETVRGLPMALYVGGPDLPPTWVMATAAPVRAADGELLGVVSTFSDVTELRRTQESLEEANEHLREQSEELEVQSEELMVQNYELTQLMAELEAERARLEVILQRMPAGVAIAAAPSGKMTLYNEEMVRIWRHPFASADDVAAWVAGRGFHPDGRAVSPEEWPLARALSTGVPQSDQEFEIVRGDGEHGIVSIGAAPIRDRSGQVAAAVMVIHDVTEHRQLERALGRARDELAALLASSGDIASTLEVEALLRIVADRLKQIVPYSGLTVYRLAEQGGTLQVVAHQGGEYVKPPQSVPVEQAAGLNKVIATGQPLLIPDLRSGSSAARTWQTASHPIQRRLVGRARCWLAVPLAVKDRMIGVLRLTHDEPGRFTDHDVELTVALARHVALAMENARLYEQAREVAAIEERQRLARDLHDAVSQTLFSAGLIADVLPRIWKQDPERVLPLLEELGGLTRGARAEMRTLLWELRPQALLESSLDQLIQQLAEAVAARATVKAQVTMAGCSHPLPPDVQVGLYRIAQETLNNVVKHAHAEHVSIDLSWPAGAGIPETAQVELSVEDDGRGFDPEAVSPARLGLKIMRERARAIGAEVTIHSQPSAGTHLTVRWPMPEGQAE